MAARRKPRTQYLSVMLIKSDEQYESDSAVIADIESRVQHRLIDQLGFTGTLYLKKQTTKKPPWLDFVNPFLTDRIQNLTVRGASAVLLIRPNKQKRRFVFVLGHGRSLLNPQCWERNFGFRVTLNSVDPNSIRTIDTRRFEDLTVETRQQLSQTSNLGTFGLDVVQDLLRQVTGKPTEPEFGTRIGGSDGLAIAAPVVFGDLGKLCRKLVSAYQGVKYKENFSFVDELQSVTDPSTVGQLNVLLCHKLAGDTSTGVHLAPPEAINWNDTRGFRYSTQDTARVYDDLEVADLLRNLRPLDGLTPERLKKCKIGVRLPSEEFQDNRWTAYDCIVFETSHDGDHYVLSGGEWYRVNKSLVDRVDHAVKEIASTTTFLPPCANGELEGDYNSKAAKESGLALVDKKCPRVDDSAIEPCDLFSKDRQLVHVKRRSRSATLSHLFAQGTVSAECIVSDEGFRSAFRKIVADASSPLGSLIPDGPPAPREFEVVYAIICRRSPNWPVSLPFFSKVNLMRHSQALRRLSFRVSLHHIEQL